MGAQVDAWPSRNVRVSAFGGSVSSNGSELTSNPDDPISRWAGSYFGAAAALELKHVGFGFGAALPSDLHLGRPSLYLRVGNLNSVHVKMESSSPSPPLNVLGDVRASLGYQLGNVRKLGGAIGVSLCNTECRVFSDKVAGFAEARVPISSAFDLEARGMFGHGRLHPEFGFGVAGRYHFIK
jgi:hypothetical protein